jgi:hypothetical protein
MSLLDELRAEAADYIAAKAKRKAEQKANRKPREPSGPAVPLVLFKRMLDVTPYTGGPTNTLADRHSYQPWVHFLFALHDAAGGDGGDYLEAVIEWCVNDPSHDWTHPTSRELIEYKWDRFSDADQRDGSAITRATWFKVLQHFGHGDLVGLAQVAEDFSEEEEPWTATPTHPSAVEPQKLWCRKYHWTQIDGVWTRRVRAKQWR